MKILAQRVINSSKRSVCCNFIFFMEIWIRKYDEASTFDTRIRMCIKTKVILFDSNLGQVRKTINEFDTHNRKFILPWKNTSVGLLYRYENSCSYVEDKGSRSYAKVWYSYLKSIYRFSKLRSKYRIPCPNLIYDVRVKIFPILIYIKYEFTNIEN